MLVQHPAAGTVASESGSARTPVNETRPVNDGVDVVLRHGSTVRVRPVHPDDQPRLYECLHTLSESARHSRGQLAQIAALRGIRRFEAVVLPENHQMLAVFRESGFPTLTHAGVGEIRVEFPTELTDAATERFEHRDSTAAASG